MQREVLCCAQLALPQLLSFVPPPCLCLLPPSLLPLCPPQSFKKKEPEPEPEPESAAGDRVPSLMNDQDSMHGSDLYERYKSASKRSPDAPAEGNFCAVCGNQVDRFKSDVSVRAGNLLCPKHLAATAPAPALST